MRPVLLVLLALGSVVASAQTAPSAAATLPPPPCESDNHRAFDFWVGEWEVTGANGNLAGHNTITKKHRGCVLHESYRTPSGYTGESFNTFDAARGVWHQTWVDNGGTLLVLEGGIKNGSMVLEGTLKNPDGSSSKQRITWTPNADGTVRQHWEAQSAAGEWTTSFDGTYRRIAGN